MLSSVDISNLALALLGAEPIRSLTENHKNARMCNQFYAQTVSAILTRLDWTFAREFEKLQKLDKTGVTLPDGMYRYQLPNQCKLPRDLYPAGSKEYWEVFGRELQCKLDDEVYLYYTKNITDSTIFSDPFIDLVALLLAIRIGPALTRDQKLVAHLYKQYKMEEREAWQIDATIGSIARPIDNLPENDTFINPGDLSSFDPKSSRFIR